MRGAAGGACLRNCHFSWSAIFCCSLLGRTEVRRRQRLSEHRGCQNRTEGRHGEDKREQQRSIFRRSPEPGRRWHFALMAAKAEDRDPCKKRERHVDCRHDANAAPYSASSMPGTSADQRTVQGGFTVSLITFGNQEMWQYQSELFRVAVRPSPIYFVW